MDRKRLEKLGDAAFTRSINPLKRSPYQTPPLIGFDTEYTSKQHKLISIQLVHDGRENFAVVEPGEKLTPARLIREIGRLGITSQEFILVTYFSYAELQHLPVSTEGFNIREYINSA